MSASRSVPILCGSVLVLMLASDHPPADAACSTGLLCPSPGACTITGNNYVDDGCALAFGARAITLHQNAKLLTAASGHGFSVRAEAITIRGTIEAHGGDVELVADGTGSGSGFVKTEKVSNSPGKIDVRDGGSVRIEAVGDVQLVGQDVNADGGSAHDGGLVAIQAANLSGTSPVHAQGTDGGSGGVIRFEIAGDVAIDAPIRAHGEGGPQQGMIPGPGGSVTIVAGDALTLEKEVLAYGELGGDGGRVDLVAGGGASIEHNVNVNGAGSTAGADGGVIDVDAGSLTITGDLTGTATTGGRGGTVRLKATTGALSATSASVVDVTGGDGGGRGGRVDVDGSGTVTLAGPISANAGGTSSSGGEVYAHAGGTLTISATVEAKSTSGSNSQDGAMIDVSGCAVALTGSLKTRNASGTGQNRITYVTGFTANGISLLADTDGGSAVTCACTDANSDAVCDTPVGCASAPSYTNVTTTPAATLTAEPLRCN